jgi:hypothetical protein
MFGLGKKKEAGTAEERALEAVLLELVGWSEEDAQALEDTLLRIAPGFFAEGSTLNRLPIERLFRLAWQQAKGYWPQVLMNVGNLEQLGKRWALAWEAKKHLVADRLERLKARAQAEKIVPT